MRHKFQQSGNSKPSRFIFQLAVAIVLLPQWATASLPARLGVYQFPKALETAAKLPTNGARIYWVIPRSPAGAGGLEPGDVITELDGESISSFSNLVNVVGSKSPGHKVSLRFRRDGVEKTVEITLSALIGDLTPKAYQSTLDYLDRLKEDHDGAVLREAIVDNLWQMGRRRDALRHVTDDLKTFPNSRTLKVRRLDLLLKNGRYDQFIAATQELAEAKPNWTEIEPLAVDAAMAAGDNHKAEQLAEQFLQHPSYPAQAAEFLRLWTLCRLRQGKPLSGDSTSDVIRRAPWSHKSLGVTRYWRNRLQGQRPYELGGEDTRAVVEFESAKVLFGLVPNRMHGIRIKVNGVDVPLAIVDTGASHTLLSTATAKQANVSIGSDQRQASGSLAFTSRPGLVDTLQIGNVVLRNVPVNVGNPPPLVMTKAKVALGVDLMHHLRFTLDYPNKQVHVAHVSVEPPEPKATDNLWDIPLWTFADHCLSRAETDDGGSARVLIDSGNFAQTLLWPTWARDNLERHPGPTGLFVYALSNPNRTIDGIRLAGVALPSWPVIDMPPVTLNGIDLLDLLMGHDLLSQYIVTVDMENRRLRLKSSGEKLKSPTAPKPFGAL